MRTSNQRNLVYDIVAASCNHPTAKMVYQAARARMPKISLGTVYRNLNELVEQKKLLRLTVQGEEDRFDKTLTIHAHLFCNKCRNLFDIGMEETTAFINHLEEINDIKILSSNIYFYGVCSKCQNKL